MTGEPGETGRGQESLGRQGEDRRAWGYRERTGEPRGTGKGQKSLSVQGEDRRAWGDREWSGEPGETGKNRRDFGTWKGQESLEPWRDR
jgi:hypothetical protein